MYAALLLIARLAAIIGLLIFGGWMAMITGGLSGSWWVVVGVVLIWTI